MRAYGICFVLVIGVQASSARGQVSIAEVLDKGDTQTLDYPVGGIETHEYDSGPWDNATGVSAMRHKHVIHMDGAAWLRVFFSDYRLEKGSFIRITSRLDGEVQELDAGALTMWGDASAFFNGDEVTVELVAGPDTVGNRFSIGEIGRLFHSPQPVGGSGECGICGSDNRVPSSEEWTARFFPAGCTASVYNEDSCMVSAGHCVGGSMVVQFNVPNSQSNCNTINPPIADQFPIVNQSSVNGGPGNDWSVLIPGTNNLGQLPFERYGAFRPIAAGPASAGQLAELTGYGVDLTCTLSQTQQFADGPISQVFSDAYTFSIDLRGGNSGSALMRNDQIIGIATHCPCPNVASRIDLPAFEAARDALCNAAPLVNDDCADAIPILVGTTAFSTIGATTDGPAHASCDTAGDGGATVNDVWYTHTATCTGTLRVTTCEQLGGSASYDTDLVVYNGTNCGSLSLLGCNDDDPVNNCGGNPDYHSTVEVSVVQGNGYLIRVGGWSQPGDQGTGVLNITCTGVSTGACCDDNDGSCVESAPAACGAGHTYQGDGSDCSPSPCPEPTGACCLSFGCVVLTSSVCLANNGDFQGGGTSCSPDPCPPLTGACCNDTTGSCVEVTAAACGAGSTYQGNGTDCSPNPCPQPTGACCNDTTGSCIEVTAAACGAGSTYQGNGTDCSPNPCPQPTGACCDDSDGSCVEVTAAACGAGSTYQGNGTDCSSNPCPQPCVLLGDIDVNGGVNGNDIPGYIRAKLGQPPAPGEDQACADYGTGSIAGDTALFVVDLLN